MSKLLFAFLDNNLGRTLDEAFGMEIMRVASMLDPLVDHEAIEQIAPMEHEGFVFAVERMENIQKEMEPLHLAHWNETEEHRHDLPFSPDYAAFIHYEQAGRYILFTIRRHERLVGNCAMYIDRSTHTQTLIASEDTLYLLPEARRGTVAKQFVAYCEAALKRLKVKEVTVTVKTVNRAGLFFQRMGYRHVENGLTKILEEDHV